jgi:hypothetical protein
MCWDVIAEEFPTSPRLRLTSRLQARYADSDIRPEEMSSVFHVCQDADHQTARQNH